MSKPLTIDGHRIRPSSIDAVTEIEVGIAVYVEGGAEQTTTARGSFDIFVRGQRIKISRHKRCENTPDAKAQAQAEVRATLQQLWDLASERIHDFGD